VTADAVQDAALEALRAHPERLEQGLVLLETHLRLDDEVALDGLARDALGYPVVVLFSSGRVEVDVGRIASVGRAVHQTRHLLKRLLEGTGLDPTLRPRYVLLAPRFPDGSADLLDHFSQLEVHAMEYRVVRTDAETSVLDLVTFHRTGTGRRASAPLPRTPAPSPPSELGDALLDGAAPDAARQLFLRARDAIRSLSHHVGERVRDGVVVYSVGDRPLASLALDHEGFRMRVDAGEEWQSVTDERTLDERLNAAFTLYFESLDPDAAES